MPKLKTHRGAAKRIKATGRGKLMQNRSNRRHLLEHKTARRKRRLREGKVLSETVQKRFRKMLPYA